MQHDDSHLDVRSNLIARAHRRALVWVTIGWGVVLVAMLLMQSSELARDWATRFDIAIVALGSLLVAAFSMVPGLTKKGSGAFFRTMLLGISIRLLGTVALFLSCRYQLASSAEVIAGMTIGWYLLLTSVEVIAVARFLANTAVNGINGGGQAAGVEPPASGHATNELPTAT